MATVVDCKRFFNCSIYTVIINETKIFVTVTASASVIDEWFNTTFICNADNLRDYRLNFGVGMDHGADTLHLCVGNRCLIVQISQADSIPPILRNVFFDLRCKFGGIYNDGHSDRMKRSKHRLVMEKNPYDVRFFLEGWLINLPLESMIYECLRFKVELKEEIRMSNWSGKDLTDDQVLFACTEVYAAFAIGVHVKMWEYCF